jgi:peptidoglycan-associated lipoprotein
MSWPHRVSRVRLGGAELRSDAGRCTLIAASAFAIYIAGDHPRIVHAEPSASAYTTPGAYGSEQRAEELYLDGVEKLDAGHRDFARQTFEQLIARYPSTAAAANARRELGELYRDGASRTAAADDHARPALAGAPPATTGSITAPVLSDLPLLPDVQPLRSRAWDQELRRNASIQSKLRVEAGDRVFFSPGSAELGSRARTALAAQAQWLTRWHEFEAAIEGHADEPGTEQENIVLSEQRAEAVRQRLIQEGVEPSRLAVVPLGRSIPVATCADTDCRAQNRRAVTLVFATGTRDRLGLVVGGTPRAAALQQPAPAAFLPAKTVEIPGGAERVGVTR